jgi:hypothetical protein
MLQRQHRSEDGKDAKSPSAMTLMLGHTSSKYFQGLGSSPKPVKLLKGLDMGELARSHSTTELLPLSPTIVKRGWGSRNWPIIT